MVVHVLNGDALAGAFAASGVHGQVIVCRECLIDGPASYVDDETFWNGRAAFIENEFETEKGEYERIVRPEFTRISELTPDDDVFLWFEHDLFCQTNMWFIVSLLKRSGLTHAYRISPLSKLNTRWQGFGNHGSDDLKICLANRIEFSKGDFTLGDELWKAYSQQDVARLMMLSGSVSPCFPRLDEVCKAETDRKKNGRPRKVLQEIVGKGHSEFAEIFSQFSQREGIYGFGDSQVRQMLRELRK